MLAIHLSFQQVLRQHDGHTLAVALPAWWSSACSFRHGFFYEGSSTAFFSTLRLFSTRTALVSKFERAFFLGRSRARARVGASARANGNLERARVHNFGVTYVPVFSFVRCCFFFVVLFLARRRV